MAKVAKSKRFIFFLFTILVVVVFYFLLPTLFPIISENRELTTNTSTSTDIVIHMNTPKPLKAIYMTACVAGTPSFREKLKIIAETTEINAIVIDIKDYTGTITFKSDNPLFKENSPKDNKGQGCQVDDLKIFISELHRSGVYVIARISTFQDKYLVSKRPDLAVKRKTDGAIWKDHKGVSWLDAGSKEVWSYISTLGREAYSIGFDELNFDYIRFPSDGDMKNIAYTFSDGRPKAEVMKDFFVYISSVFKPLNVPISADLFGMTTTNKDDLNIGQLLEDALLYFDYVAPMVYPSHYPPTFLNFTNPAEHPYEVVSYSMKSAVERANLASTTPYKLRPWLQDFDLGATYTPGMIRAQIKATYDVGLDSWMLWDAGNTYTVKALWPKGFSEKDAMASSTISI
ncbi:MAG: putative glycoside hydrolase [Candidatus Paceibacterota bacterium]|jgi:hypothetical protein